MFRKLHYGRQTGKRKKQTCRLDWYTPQVAQFFQPSEFFYQFICNDCNNKNTSRIPIPFPVSARFWLAVTKRTRKCSGSIVRMRLSSIASPLPDFKPWGTRYESVNYGISILLST